MTERESIEAVIEKLQDLKLSVHLTPQKAQDATSSPFDAMLMLEAGQQRQYFQVVVINRLNVATAARLAGLVAQTGTKGKAEILVIADHIQPAVAEILEEHGLHYADSHGNIQILSPPLLIHVRGIKKKSTREEKPIRAFKGEGLRVIFALLLAKELVSTSYRNLAELTGASHGVVQYTLKDLERLDYVVRLGRSNRMLREAEHLLDRWAEAYAENFKSKISYGWYEFTNEETRSNWTEIELDTDLERWGSEPAAAIKTKYLKPELLTIYTREAKAAFIRKFRIRPAGKREVEVVRSFWPVQLETELPQHFEGRCVPDIVTYADLVATNDPRNAEVAAKLRTEIIGGLNAS